MQVDLRSRRRHREAGNFQQALLMFHSQRRFESLEREVAEKFGPYVYKGGVIDCGKLMDFVSADAMAAKAKSREEAIRVLAGIKAAHADWLKGHHLSGRALRRAGTPFSEAYDDLERWLQQTAPPKRARPKSGFVYVIGMEDDTTAVKIGFAT